jgi:hypothetical protein
VHAQEFQGIEWSLMVETSEKNDLMAQRVGRFMPGKPVLPKHLRLIGGYFLFAFSFLAGVNVYSWQKHELWPNALIIAPSVLLLGVWMLIDATALAAGSRRHQRAILWACIVLGSGVGMTILHELTGSFL